MTKTHPDATLVALAGNPTKLSKLLNAKLRPKRPLTISAVNQWRYRGVAPAWRPAFAELCGTIGVAVPKGWLEPDARHSVDDNQPAPAYLETSE